MIFGDFGFEEIRFLFHIHQFGEPRERVCAGAVERVQADTFEAAVADVVDVGEKFIRGEAYGMNRQAILDEALLQSHRLRHGCAQIVADMASFTSPLRKTIRSRSKRE